MVQAMIRISEKTNHVINIVKAKYQLKDKSAAIEEIVRNYEAEFLDPPLRPGYVRKMLRRKKDPTVRVKNFKKHFGLK